MHLLDQDVEKVLTVYVILAGCLAEEYQVLLSGKLLGCLYCHLAVERSLVGNPAHELTRVLNIAVSRSQTALNVIHAHYFRPLDYALLWVFEQLAGVLLAYVRRLTAELCRFSHLTLHSCPWNGSASDSLIRSRAQIYNTWVSRRNQASLPWISMRDAHILDLSPRDIRRPSLLEVT